MKVTIDLYATHIHPATFLSLRFFLKEVFGKKISYLASTLPHREIFESFLVLLLECQYFCHGNAE